MLNRYKNQTTENQTKPVKAVVGNNGNRETVANASRGGVWGKRARRTARKTKCGAAANHSKPNAGAGASARNACAPLLRGGVSVNGERARNVTQPTVMRMLVFASSVFMRNQPAHKRRCTCGTLCRVWVMRAMRGNARAGKTRVRTTGVMPAPRMGGKGWVPWWGRSGGRARASALYGNPNRSKERQTARALSCVVCVVWCGTSNRWCV